MLCMLCILCKLCCTHDVNVLAVHAMKARLRTVDKLRLRSAVGLVSRNAYAVHTVLWSAHAVDAYDVHAIIHSSGTPCIHFAARLGPPMLCMMPMLDPLATRARLSTI